MSDLTELEMLLHGEAKLIFNDIFTSTLTTLLVLVIYLYFMNLALSFIKKI